MWLDFLSWVELAFRWMHVIAGISWIGTSFYFVWLDNSLRKAKGMPPGVAGELWAVHGGGFYHKQKYAVAPEHMPEDLHWFKWEAYFTWISGFLLLATIYYIGADIFLIDRAKVALAAPQAIALSLAFLVGGWVVYDGLCRSPVGKNAGLFATIWFAALVGATYALTRIFSDRAAILHVGAIIGTVMAANVFMIIIPNQRKVTADMIAGRAPDPRLGQQAKQRSLHNNYMTLPVVVTMISGHYPILFGSSVNWLLLAGLALAGVLVRHFFNRKNQGVTNYLWIGAAAAVFFGVVVVAHDANPAIATTGAVRFSEIRTIVYRHCIACHSAHPTHAGIAAPPKGLDFTQGGVLHQHAVQIQQQAVATQTMPLGNETGMTAEERAKLGQWIAAGAHEEAP